MTDLLNPKSVKIKDMKGVEREYLLGDIPYLSGGREIASQFVSSAMPKVGDYKLNEELCRKMFKFIAVVTDAGAVKLETDALVNNHVPDFMTGIKLEEAMLENCLGFSIAGKVREYQQEWKTNGAEWITKTLTQLLAALQKQGNVRGKSSKRSIQ